MSNQIVTLPFLYLAVFVCSTIKCNTVMFVCLLDLSQDTIANMDELQNFQWNVPSWKLSFEGQHIWSMRFHHQEVLSYFFLWYVLMWSCGCIFLPLLRSEKRDTQPCWNLVSMRRGWKADSVYTPYSGCPNYGRNSILEDLHFHLGTITSLTKLRHSSDLLLPR